MGAQDRPGVSAQLGLIGSQAIPIALGNAVGRPAVPAGVFIQGGPTCGVTSQPSSFRATAANRCRFGPLAGIGERQGTTKKPGCGKPGANVQAASMGALGCLSAKRAWIRGQPHGKCLTVQFTGVTLATRPPWRWIICWASSNLLNGTNRTALARLCRRYSVRPVTSMR